MQRFRDFFWQRRWGRGLRQNWLGIRFAKGFRGFGGRTRTGLGVGGVAQRGEQSGTKFPASSGWRTGRSIHDPAVEFGDDQAGHV